MAPRTGRSEQGAITIFFALFILAVMTMVAVVVDIGRVRSARRTSQSAADFAAIAAGQEVSDAGGGGPRGACREALDYLRANLEGIPAGASLPCDTIPNRCDTASDPVTVTDGGTARPFEIAVTYPVSDADIADAEVGGLRVTDGEPCERFGVEVGFTVEALFAGVVGIDSLPTGARAVARGTPAWLRQAPNLWLLDPTGCTALSVQGGSQVVVGTPTAPGLITLDSTATTCQNNETAIDVGGTGSRIRAIPATTNPPGRISLVAMVSGQRRCDDGNPNACEQSDVDAGMLDPQPLRRYTRATRARVDHRFNCRSSYPDYHGIPIAACPEADTRPAYVDDLRSTLGESGAPLSFQRWSDSYGCNNPSVPAELPGNWWIDCRDLRIGNVDVNFTGGNVLFDGDVTMTGGSLRFNTDNPVATLASECLGVVSGCAGESAQDAAYVFLRDGDLKMTGGTLEVEHAAVFLDDGDLQLAGGSPPVWSAARVGPFAALALWAEEPSTRFRINGGASMDLGGVFFTPEADAFTLTGGSPLIPQKAQFISFRLAVSGGGVLNLDPEGLGLIEFAAEPAILIR